MTIDNEHHSQLFTADRHPTCMIDGAQFVGRDLHRQRLPIPEARKRPHKKIQRRLDLIELLVWADVLDVDAVDAVERLRKKMRRKQAR